MEHSNAMLVALRVSTWTAQKFDRKVSKEVTDSKGAASDAGRFNKHLISKTATIGASYRELMASASEARTRHYEQTLPWTDEGWRLLPSMNFFSYSTIMRGSISRFKNALPMFVADFPQLRESARHRMGGLFNYDDFPLVSEIEHKFRIAIEYSPLPEAGDFRLDLPEEAMEVIRKETENRVQAALNLAMQDAWARLFNVVEKLHEKVASPDGIFRDSLVENVRDVCDILGRLNISNDPYLEEMRKSVETHLATVDPTDLREDERTRNIVAQKAAAIMETMKEFYSPQGVAK